MINTADLSRINDYNIELLAELDAQGFILAPGENAEMFKNRVSTQFGNISLIDEALRNGREFDLEGICKLKSEDKISSEIMEEASLITNEAYAFRTTWH